VEGKQITETEHKQIIDNYVNSCSGLTIAWSTTETFRIEQSADGKVLDIPLDCIEKVISREDSQGNPFVQLNLLDDKKLLLTDTLVGFKPMPRPGLDMQRIPKVVTTPDLIGVIEAIEDSISSNVAYEDMESLRCLFYSVIEGAEHIGFDLQAEKLWLHQIVRIGGRATA